MNERKDTPLDLGIYGRPVQRRFSATDIVAVLLTLLWLGGVVLFFFVLKPEGAVDINPLNFVLTLLAIFLPVALIWVAAAVAKTARVMREEAKRLQSAIDAMRHTYVLQQQNAGMQIKPSVERKLDEIAQAQRKTESAIATFTTSRPGPAAAEPARKPALPARDGPDRATEDQPALALGTPAAEIAAPLSVADFLKAMNFPEDEDDAEGFRALRRALQDPETARLIRASQDLLTLLSQDGIYMDDLVVSHAPAEIWRRFASGVRGQEIAELAGISDRSALAMTNGRMKTDAVFRDSVLHFLRQFDKVATQFLERASDDDIAAFANTRTARAFMITGRVAGTFD